MDKLLSQLFASPPGSEPITWEEIVLYMLLSFVLSQLLAWVYIWTHKGLSYSRSQVQSLVLISIIVTAVMLAIGNNVARAFGLFGALALIRFRTPVKDTRDTVFLFMAVGIGITLGTRNVMLATIGTSSFGLVAMYLAFSRFGERSNSDAVLRFAMPAQGEQETLLRRILSHYCQRFALVHLREAGPDANMEFAYQIKMYDPQQTSGLLTDLGTIPGVSGLNLLVQNEDEEV
jgi:Domain of unknown function (DUF4956)